jgi:ABC-type dipeptide/oligopeptide/nickel transport systems, permease components
VIAYVLKRAGFSLFVLWGAVTVVFIALRIVPADPALLILGVDATPDQLAALRERLGLDRPLILQYFSYLQGAVTLDFGDSYRLQRDAMGLVMERLPATGQLALAAVIFAVVVGLALGLVAALRVNTFLDRTISVVSLAFQSLPSFWIGLVLVLVFARALHLLPSGGTGSLAHLVLPALTLSLPFLAILARLTRSGILEVINEGYIQTARSKGFSERVVLFPHAIRNALIPIVTVVGLQFGQVLGGAVIIETVFAWPGVGRVLVESINYRDYNVVQACVVVIAAIFIVINLIVDVTYGFLDPRIRLGARR